MMDAEALVCVVDNDARVPPEPFAVSGAAGRGLRVGTGVPAQSAPGGAQLPGARCAAAGPQRTGAAAAAGGGRYGHAYYLHHRPRRYPDDCAGDESRGRGVFVQALRVQIAS